MDMEINFPNLGIYLDHVGKSISIFGFSIAYYGIVIVTGMMIAIWIAQREAKRTGRTRSSIRSCDDRHRSRYSRGADLLRYICLGLL